MIPGEFILKPDDIIANDGRKTLSIGITNTGDRPIQVGSHYHFFEVNQAMLFDRTATIGMRLNIPAGTAVRFEPGEEKIVELTEFAGNKIVFGFQGAVNGALHKS